MEVWKDIKGFEGRYQVSDLGRVKSLSRKLKTKHGYRTTTDRILKITPDIYGYCVVYLSTPTLTKRRRVHRLVADAFISNPEGKPIINHIDGNKTNNVVYNIEWCTPQENVSHAMKIGLTDGMNGSILEKRDVMQIKVLLKQGELQSKLAKMYGVSRSAITDINNGRTWKSV